MADLSRADVPEAADASRASRAHLIGRLQVIEERVRAAVAVRRAGDPDPNDRFRGLYITDAHVDHLLGGESAPDMLAEPTPEGADLLRSVERDADAAASAGETLRLRAVADAFGLDQFAIEMLLVALAPDVDSRFERLYAYLQDDVSRRRASAGLALELCGGRSASSTQRQRLGPSAPLVAGGLLTVDDPDRPFLTRSLRVPDRVTAHLLGDDAPDAVVAAMRADAAPAESPVADRLARALSAGVRLAYLQEQSGASGRSVGARALVVCGLRYVAVDLSRPTSGDDLTYAMNAAVREVRLSGAGLIAGPVDALLERGASPITLMADAPATVILIGTRAWDPGWAHAVPFVLEATPTPPTSRANAWRQALGTGDAGEAPALVHYRMGPEQVQRAAHAARQEAAADGRNVTIDDLQAGVRQQNAAGLERLARRIHPVVAWTDLVLPDNVITQLREITARARFRDVVLDTWGMGSRSSKGRGLTALFAGDSGTGKTMSAEVVAGDLGLDLYVIDLSTVIDKYVGETEKNLDRIFAEADRVNGVLLFDEADAIFGKRSDVKDSHDRYANVEVAYLLQRMELFDGLAILTSNLRSNVDEAFTRRLDALVDFPMPDEDDRRRLWEKNLFGAIPMGDDLDLDFLARSFKLSGGNIRNVALAAAYLAAAEARGVTMRDLIHGTVREYQKLGRLTVAEEFGSYIDLVAD